MNLKQGCRCMTNEEALYWLKHIRDTIVGIHSPMARTGKTYNFKRVMALDMAIQAVEKQMPKKPKGDCYKCPNCNSYIFKLWDSYVFCPYCGQALKREE